MWRPFLQAFFFRHSHNVDGTAYIYENDFHDLLLDLKLYKSPKAFDILWQAVDYDLSGSLDWEEIEQVFWPLEQATAEDPVVATIRVKMQSLLSKRKLPLEEWEPAVKELFSVFDKGKHHLNESLPNPCPGLKLKTNDPLVYKTINYLPVP